MDQDHRPESEQLRPGSAQESESRQDEEHVKSGVEAENRRQIGGDELRSHEYISYGVQVFRAL